MTSGSPKFDWIGFAVHGVFGAVFGAAVGAYALVRSRAGYAVSALPAVTIIAGSALVCGILAGLCKDRFWTGISRSAGGDWFKWQWFVIKVLLVAAVIVWFVWGIVKWCM